MTSSNLQTRLSVVGGVTLLCLGLWQSPARAQSTDVGQPGFSVERLLSEPGPGTIIGAHSAEVLPSGAWTFGALGSLMSRPIILRDIRTGEEALVPVSLRLGYEFTMARGITSRFQLGLAIPLIAAQEGERLQGIGLSEESLRPVTLGDIRIHAKLRLNEDARSALGYGMAFHIGLPTGDQTHFAGESGVVLSWTMLSSYRWHGLRVVGNFGLRIRSKESVLLSPARAHGNELLLTLAGQYRLPASWEFPVAGLLEIAKVEGDNLGPSPGEIRTGIKAFILPRATLKLVYGRGYTPAEVGAPDWRIALAFRYEGR
ncbi:MAG: hypothetical protein JKY56_14160 [Kofleriaceae bacterium]|nr:hypothetical protein [Kofleriaceae bacterium]